MELYLIYSQWIDGGIIPITLALGRIRIYSTWNYVLNLYLKNPLQLSQLMLLTFKPKEAGKPFHPAKVCY